MKPAMQAMPATEGLRKTDAAQLHIGSVSFLNAKPLIYGLERFEDLSLQLDVPSRLLAGLRERRFDIALLPVIDYQRLSGLRVVPSAAIGCDGPTLTVRIFSKVPIERIRTLACDTDSHTSVALARIIFAERFGIRPEFVDWKRGSNDPVDARLLIGDKVVCEEPPGFDHQLDLGHAWKEMTGMPFVFAIWTARQGVDLGDLPQRLRRARERGIRRIDEIIERHALPRGWPAGMALQYLTVYLKFDVGERELAAINHFFGLAHRHGVLDASPPRGVEIYDGRAQAAVERPADTST
jgi:chorismate dehydratase